MKPVTACTPLEEGMSFTVQDNLGRGLPSTVQVSVTVSSLNILLNVWDNGVAWMLCKTAQRSVNTLIYKIDPHATHMWEEHKHLLLHWYTDCFQLDHHLMMHTDRTQHC